MSALNQTPAAPLTATTDAERALAAGIAPRRWGSWYVAEHRLRGMKGYLPDAIFQSFGNPLIYLFALGVGLASLVPQGVGGVTYLQFVAPALMATAAMTIAANETSYPIMAGFKWNPIFFAMNAAPISPAQIVNGTMIQLAIRIVVTVAIYFGIIILFGAVPSPAGWLAIIAATLTGMAIGAAQASYTSTITEDKGQMAMLQRFAITPLFLFSGTFFPLEQLPLWLQPLGWASPLWHGTELGRVFSYGLEEPLWLTVTRVGYLVTLFAVGLWATHRHFARRLNK
ncbi:ABC transporter permease [Microcella frigidaquae]|uniref:Transport permease protein n=1 Tax=Microcella frigidaquae TaxID=424758 RepID=A0A840XBB7_9MICO|nr:ABC transporter permease [Microcella frigidaquae]MBB5618454.1 lipooligosaccharide transport system permease protein [Microcella frigidaquae]NHN44646.1 ABC transporter permease [Microcella frigidaquae]